VTVTKALRTCVPFNCCGRLDSCARDLVVGYRFKVLAAVRASKTVAFSEDGGKACNYGQPGRLFPGARIAPSGDGSQCLADHREALLAR